MPRLKWLLPLIMLLLLLAAGCGQSVPTSNKQDVNSITNKQDANILRVAVVGSQRDAEEQSDINKLIVPQMQANYITTETVRCAEKELLANIRSENGADVYVLPTRATAISLDQLGAVLRLDDVVDKLLPNMELLYNAAIMNAKWQGHLIGIPRTIDPNVVIYNVDHFKTAKVNPDPEWDWSGFINASVSVGNSRGKTNSTPKSPAPAKLGGTASGAATVDFSASDLLSFLLSHGGGLIDDSEVISIDSAASIGTLIWLQEQITQGNMRQDFVSQTALDKEDASFGLCSLSALNQLNAGKLRFRALPAPKSPKTQQSVVTTTTSLYVINAKSPNVDLAIDFVIASLNPKIQTQTASITGFLPVNRDARLPIRSWLPSKKIVDSILDNALPQILPAIGERSIWLPVKNEMRKLGDGGDVNILAKSIVSELQTIISLKDQPLKQEDRVSLFPSVTLNAQVPPSSNFTGTTVKWFTTQRMLVPLVSAFNISQPPNGVYVLMVYPEKGEDSSAFIKRGLTDKTADIVDVYSPDAPSHIAQGLLAPLDKLFLGQTKGNFDGGILNQLKQNGVAYIFPISRGPFIVYTSQKTWKATGWAFPTKGWTWDEFNQWYSKAAVANAGAYALTSRTWTFLFYQMGGRLANGPYSCAERGLSFINSLKRQVSTDVSNSFSLNDIINGKAIASIQLNTYASRDFKSIEQAKLTVLPLPTIKANLVGGGFSTNHIAISAKAPHQNAAFQFLNWLYSEKGSLAYTQLQQGNIPLTLYPTIYHEMRGFWGSNVEMLFPVSYHGFNEINLHYNQLFSSALSIADNYFAGKSTLKQAVSTLETTLPRIAQGLQ